MSLRAAIVGARRCRQGTGEFVARELQRAGCSVRAIVGTREETTEAARRDLEQRYGITCRGYLSLEQLLEAEQIDVVAVCSPAETHPAQIRCAVDAGCHVFCEKPLWWEPDLTRRTDVAERAQALVERFHSRGRYLALNTQWPFTLEVFDRLHPNAHGINRPVEQFSMRLSPTSLGPQAVADSASHLLSMLQALVGAGTVTDEVVTYHDALGADLEVGLTYTHAAGATLTTLRLIGCAEPPRPASYAINGNSVDRDIELPSYRISFRARGRSVPVEDPLALAVVDFVAGARAGRLPDGQALVASMTQLQQLVRAAEQNHPRRNYRPPPERNRSS